MRDPIQIKRIIILFLPMPAVLIGQLSEPVLAIMALINGDAGVMKKGRRLKEPSASPLFPLPCILESRSVAKNLLKFSLHLVSVYKPGVLFNSSDVT